MEHNYTRRFSLEEDFMHYSVDDLLYGMMQYLATYHPIEKRLYLTKASYERHRKEFYKIHDGVDNCKKLKAHLEKLINRGLVEETTVLCGKSERESYVFPYEKEEKTKYQIIDNEMLFYVISTRNKSAIQIYIYLLNKYLWKKEKGEMYVFDNTELQVAIGYSEFTNLSSAWVTNILESFQREGVLNYEEFYQETINENTGEVIRFPQKRLTFVAQKKDELRRVGGWHE